MGLAGKLKHHLYYRPIGAIRSSVRQGGPWAIRETERQRLEMEVAAKSLPCLTLPPSDAPCSLHLMTGARFWYQTAFCVHSFARHAGAAVKIEIYDDGSLTPGHRVSLEALGLPVVFHDKIELSARVERLLPAAKFPVLRDRWNSYPNIRKLIDVHLGSSGWKLVIDSDLLFFRNPAFLMRWMRLPDLPLHAIDCQESYGYSRPLMTRLTGSPIGHKINVGLCGLNSSDLDWEKLESWCAELIANEGQNYYLEQALVAMLVAGRHCAVAPEKDYLTLPSKQEVLHPTAVMQHYVDTAKRWYFRYGWRQALR